MRHIQHFRVFKSRLGGRRSYPILLACAAEQSAAIYLALKRLTLSPDRALHPSKTIAMFNEKRKFDNNVEVVFSAFSFCRNSKVHVHIEMKFAGNQNYQNRTMQQNIAYICNSHSDSGHTLDVLAHYTSTSTYDVNMRENGWDHTPS